MPLREPTKWPFRRPMAAGGGPPSRAPERPLRVVDAIAGRRGSTLEGLRRSSLPVLRITRRESAPCCLRRRREYPRTRRPGVDLDEGVRRTGRHLKSHLTDKTRLALRTNVSVAREPCCWAGQHEKSRCARDRDIGVTTFILQLLSGVTGAKVRKRTFVHA